METLWLNLEDAPVGAKVAHGLLVSVLEQVRHHSDRDDLEPLDPEATVSSLDWEPVSERATFAYPHATFSVDLSTGCVCEHRCGNVTVYGPAGRVFSVEPAGPTPIRLHDVRSRSTAPPAPSRN